jgi:asparagine synthase (glutamine-hydrolysing)
MLEAGPELRLGSDEDYAEAFLDVFTEAVRCRLRSHGRVGSMLSGGMDSGSVVAVASELLEKEGRGPLPTFSAISSQPENCIESRTLQLTQSLTGLQTDTIDPQEFTKTGQEYLSLLRNAGEPFDSRMTLVWAVYQMARNRGVKVLMDGVLGDNVLSETGYVPRLIRHGDWLTAYREARLRNKFLNGDAPVIVQLLSSAKSAFTPDILKLVYRRYLAGHLNARFSRAQIHQSGINTNFARKIDLVGRFRIISDFKSAPIHASLGEVTALEMQRPYVSAAIERYGRVASSLGMERRHPWVDRRLVEFCLSLPGDQRLAQGWPKAILRRAMEGHLPEGVRYRNGKEHLGWQFTCAFTDAARALLQEIILRQRDRLTAFVSDNAIEKALAWPNGDNSVASQGLFFRLICLASWLESRDSF